MSSAYRVGPDMAQQHFLRDNPDAALFPKSYMTSSSFVTIPSPIQLIEPIVFLMILSLVIYCAVKLCLFIIRKLVNISRQKPTLPMHTTDMNQSPHGLGFTTPPGLSFSPTNSPVMSPDDMSRRIDNQPHHLTNRKTAFNKPELTSPLDNIRASHIVYS